MKEQQVQRTATEAIASRDLDKLARSHFQTTEQINQLKGDLARIKEVAIEVLVQNNMLNALNVRWDCIYPPRMRKHDQAERIK